MADIAFVAPSPDLYRDAKAALHARHKHIRLVEGLLGKGAQAAAQLAREGVEVVVSRGGTAEAIAKAVPGLTVVAVPTTGFDVLRAIGKAKSHGQRIGVVAFPSMTTGMGSIGNLLGLDVRVYDLADEAEAEGLVLRARDEGAQVVVGGIISALTAERLGIPAQAIESGLESILGAVEEAERVGHALDGEKAKGELLRAVLANVADGIVAVDGHGRVTLCNPVAARAVRLEEKAVLGRPVRTVWPELRLEKVARGGRDERGHILKVFDQEVICDKIALAVGDRTAGAVATFHDVRRIQKMEAAVRRRALDAGHVAAARFADILGESQAIRQAIELGMDYARSDATVLVTGETGTGKELFAQGLHNHGRRPMGPFVAVNCAALPGQLLESELFGYTAGAFTGASPKGKAGLFELAHGGTIFLDEVAEADPVVQAKLLRVLQEKKVMRVGGDHVVPVDVRVVAATNKDLRDMVERRLFRADLYYRLNVLHLPLPPLRERREDVPILARHFLRALGRPLALSPACLAVLKRHPWPGNVREVQNAAARIAASCKEETVTEALVRRVLQEPGPDAAGGMSEAREIRAALEGAKGKLVDAAKALGISRSTLWRRMKHLGMS
ncbi:sigma 54-interacting transcriptional regulator [Solidesulfovibrio sp.]|uniref:sigma 54-interacting transcriptional regulator n=1 Tax=Solidesulfovibrio sp. TaxID=2910990 RepID=UPI0026290610|nr:sigma 54-interacting transcriptional regulator [Solidesulfovibrio sp.]